MTDVQCSVESLSDGAASHAAVGGGRGRHVSGHVCHSVSVRVRNVCVRVCTRLSVSHVIITILIRCDELTLSKRIA